MHVHVLLHCMCMYVFPANRHGTACAHQYIKMADNEGNTALHLAVQNGAEEVR